MELVFPSSEYKDSYIAAVREFQSDRGPNHRAHPYLQLSIPELESDFDTYVAKVRSEAEGKNLPEGWVSATTYWLVEGSEFIGRVSIRHRLTDYLEKVGGHIGYDIRTSQRNKGYGSMILQLALPKARELGIDCVLITCDATNVASRKIIEKNGGVYENSSIDPVTGIEKLRFWIHS